MNMAPYPDLGTAFVAKGMHEAKKLALANVRLLTVMQDSPTEANTSFTFELDGTLYMGSALIELGEESAEQVARRLGGCDLFVGTLSEDDKITGRNGEEYIAFRGDFYKDDEHVDIRSDG